MNPRSFLLVLLLAACSPHTSAPVRNITPSPAPDFSLPDLRDQALDSQSLRGHIVVLTLWTTWSPAAIAQIDDLRTLRTRFTGQGVDILGVALQEAGVRDLAAFQQYSPVDYPLLRAPEDFHRKFGAIDAVPTTFLINEKWELVNRHTGRVSLDALANEVRWMLREKQQREKGR